MWNQQREVKKYLEERGWTENVPANLAKSIMIEGAELLEHFQWNHRPKEEVRKDPKLVKEISHEMADIIIYALDLSIALGIDLEKTVTEKLEIVKKKYPVKEVLHNSDAYYKIKKAYRAKKS